jgi:hypothetical protein
MVVVVMVVVVMVVVVVLSFCSGATYRNWAFDSLYEPCKRCAETGGNYIE